MMQRSTRTAAALVTALAIGSATAAFAGGTPEQKCAAAKRKAIGKYVAGILDCLAKAVAAGTPLDPACIPKVAGKGAAAFAKAELAGCATTGDWNALATRAVAFVDAVDASLPTVPFPPTSADGVHNGLETGVDCGGACAPCP